jgi:hypothetical protein
MTPVLPLEVLEPAHPRARGPSVGAALWHPFWHPIAQHWMSQDEKPYPGDARTRRKPDKMG